jgi:mRNA interferase MazF
MIEPGMIFWSDLDPAGRHPVIVVSREALNRGGYALAVVCTTARPTIRSKLPNCVPFRAGEFGLPADCVAQCEYLLTIEQDRLDTPIGRIDEATLREVIKAIGYVMDADCEPC